MSNIERRNLRSEQAQVPRKNEVSIVRSSAAEYLTFVAATGNAETSVEMRYEDENIWLTQKMMATVYDVSVPAISQHLKRIYSDNELERDATIKQYLTVQTEGHRSVQRNVEHYSLQAIIAVGFKIENERAVQFRKWANQIVNIACTASSNWRLGDTGQCESACLSQSEGEKTRSCLIA